MKVFVALLFGIMGMSFTIWQPDFEIAKKTAKEKHCLILLNFSGSDWCSPCINLRKEIFDSEVFLKMADSNLVLVNADFPRNKKNQLTPLQKKQNEGLADIYNASGKFPYTLLLDCDGKVIKTWDGLPEEKAAGFAAEVKRICDAHK